MTATINHCDRCGHETLRRVPGGTYLCAACDPSSGEPWTHFHRGRQGTQLFTVASCETCGQPVREANGVKGYGRRHTFLERGLIEATELPPEDFVNTADGRCACPRCA